MYLVCSGIASRVLRSEHLIISCLWYIWAIIRYVIRRPAHSLEVSSVAFMVLTLFAKSLDWAIPKAKVNTVDNVTTLSTEHNRCSDDTKDPDNLSVSMSHEGFTGIRDPISSWSIRVKFAFSVTRRSEVRGFEDRAVSSGEMSDTARRYESQWRCQLRS